MSLTLFDFLPHRFKIFFCNNGRHFLMPWCTREIMGVRVINSQRETNNAKRRNNPSHVLFVSVYTYVYALCVLHLLIFSRILCCMQLHTQVSQFLRNPVVESRLCFLPAFLFCSVKSEETRERHVMEPVGHFQIIHCLMDHLLSQDRNHSLQGLELLWDPWRVTTCCHATISLTCGSCATVHTIRAGL